MGKKKHELATGYVTITPSFDGFDADLDTLADKIQATIEQAVKDGIVAGITAGLRQALPTSRLDIMRQGGMRDGRGVN